MRHSGGKLNILGEMPKDLFLSPLPPLPHAWRCSLQLRGETSFPTITCFGVAISTTASILPMKKSSILLNARTGGNLWNLTSYSYRSQVGK